MKLSYGFKSQLRTMTMVFALLAIWAIFHAVTHGAFLQPRNLSNLFRQMSITAILATGMVLIIVAGHIDLSVGSTVAFLGAILAILTTNQGLSPSLAFGIAVVAGLLIGGAQGYLVAYQRIPAFIVTLGGMLAFRGASMWVTKGNTIPLGENWLARLGTDYVSAFTGWILAILAVALLWASAWWGRKSGARYGLPAEAAWKSIGRTGGLSLLILGFMKVMADYQGIPIPVLVMLTLMLLFHFLATQTTFGRHVYAIGGNPEAAYMSGIPVRRRSLGVFLLMGALSAVAATVLTARVGSASPDAGGLLELDAIASCVIGGTSLMGGKGSVLGAILGALVMESLNNGMSLANMESFWQYVLKGLVLIGAVWIDALSQEKK
jgi:D-xylose transport system permease protein